MPAEKARTDPTPWLHSGLTLAAVIGLAINLRTFWTAFALPDPGLALALTGCYLAMLVAAVLALCLRSSRALARVDVLVLVTAIVIKGIALWPAITGEHDIDVDEGILMDRASRAITYGFDPYQLSWPYINPDTATRLMDGGGAFTFGYPPFGIQLGALFQWLGGGAVVGIVVAATLALFATAIIAFCVAPAPLRPLATLGILGTGILTAYAENAYPSMIALPFLCLAVWKWTSIGRGGRLGFGGVLRAVAIGLAVCTHQLGWFLSIFLLVGIILLRRGELSWARTLLLAARYVGIAVLVAVAVNAPFALRDPVTWIHGITEPLTQHAVPHGQGIMAVTYHLIRGSGALDFYGHATIAMLVALIAAYAVNIRSWGPAAVILPWIVFWVALRSQDGYWVLTMPLWVVGLCTTSRADFATAYQLLHRRRRPVPPTSVVSEPAPVVPEPVPAESVPAEPASVEAAAAVEPPASVNAPASVKAPAKSSVLASSGAAPDSSSEPVDLELDEPEKPEKPEGPESERETERQPEPIIAPRKSRIGTVLRAAVTVILFLPVATCLTVAMTSPAPLTFQVMSPLVFGEKVERLVVAVTNDSDHPLSPSFTVTTGVYMGQFWKVNHGPATLEPGGSAVYFLIPPKVWRPKLTEIPLLRAVSDGPQTLSSMLLAPVYYGTPFPLPRDKPTRKR
ncbi:hypothetical protein [Actinoplanes rectilineatus]|uniref:hypothetical protein n=1 Tax=Actinoplanes rectilineatus TaxID=113571 RepID=UPI000697EDA5|nr:hypothetical protein [Actinoplanes rectilineatus]